MCSVRECRCGAVYAVALNTMNEGYNPIYCIYCGDRICDPTESAVLTSDRNVSQMLRNAKQEYETAIARYIHMYGYGGSTKEYVKIRDHWKETVANELECIDKEGRG